MSSIFIREAKPADLNALLEFEQGIVSWERPFDDTLKEGEIHYYDLGAMIVADDVRVVVAESEGRAVGSGYARIEQGKAYQKFERYAYLGCMYVLPEFRGKGVNSMVLDELISWCRSANITEIRLEVYHNNYTAIKAYEKAGFKPGLTWMRLGLDEG
jgi:ribosomal protein S18 acetylase RimI-like enzyme